MTTDEVIRGLRERGLVPLVRNVARVYHVTFRELCGRMGTKRVSQARAALWAELHGMGFSYPEIGLMFDRDHTTIIHSVQRHRRRTKRGTEGDAERDSDENGPTSDESGGVPAPVDRGDDR